MTNSPTLDVHNPSTGDLFSSVSADTMDSATAKLDAAFRLFKSPEKRLALHERIELLEKLVVYLEANRSEFIDTMIQEGGKPRRDSIVEFDRALEGVKLSIGAVSEHAGSSIPLGYQASSAGRIATTRVFPRGVVLAFSAFNHPLNLIVHQIIPAFATGCPCIVKPSGDTPLSCLLLVKAMHAVGIPADYIQAVVPTERKISTMLVESEKIAFFSFIGSARVGWMLRSSLHPGVRCALEHGGVAPCIVSSKANLDVAVSAILKGGFYHAGQVCVSTQRVYVDTSVMDDFIKLFKAGAESLKVGNAFDEDTQVGPLIREAEVERVQAWVDEAISEGAECLVGGKAIDERYFPPTVLLNPSSESKVSRAEIFGPVVCVYSYDNFETALQLANHDEVAFQSALFSDDINEIMRAFEMIDASALMVNDHTAFRDDVMPFAGLKSSGLGVGGIPYSVEEMQYEKMLVLK